MINKELLMPVEEVIFNLRELYSSFGYSQYQMSKFEEYELYIKHKEFMVSDRVISFNDTNGKLLALKPDVTLSIIKSGEDIPGNKQKVFYNENVYRISENTNRFKEIMQAGLECIGDLSFYDLFEVILLSAESLSKVNEEFVLQISHLGLLTKVINSICPDSSFLSSVLKCIAEKNPHDLKKLCDKNAVSSNDYEKLSTLATLSGNRKVVIEKLKEIISCEEIKEMETLSNMLSSSPLSDKIVIDFSVTNDTNYYNGFVFKGFINGIASSVLSGGQYDNMMKKMDRNSKAIGFAIYLDLLDQNQKSSNINDSSFYVLYDNKTNSDTLSKTVVELSNSEKCFKVVENIPNEVSNKMIIDLRGSK